jgi:hypothetical protein
VVQQCDRSGIGDVSNGLPIDALQQSRRDLVPVFYERPHAIGIEHEIMLISGILPRWQMIGVAFVCAILQEAFSNLPPVKRSGGLFSRSQVLLERGYLSSSQCEIAAS